MTDEVKIGGIPVETFEAATPTAEDSAAVGKEVLNIAGSDTATDPDDYTIVDPVTGERKINPKSDQANSRDADGDPITDGGM